MRPRLILTVQPVFSKLVLSWHNVGAEAHNDEMLMVSLSFASRHRRRMARRLTTFIQIKLTPKRRCYVH
jgi:hypothetical protein